MSNPTELRARAAELEQRVPPIHAGPRTDDERMWLEKAAALCTEADQLDWERTGRIPCSDCGTVVRTDTLETLPAHNCAAHQRARSEREAADRDDEE